MNKGIIFKDVYKSFGDLKVLQGINFEIEKGEIVCLLGSSGCGKSTCLRMINLLEQKDAGEIYVGDKSIDDIDNINEYRRSVAMVFQQFNLFKNLNVLDNCTIALRKTLKMDKRQAEEIAIKNLEKVGMANFINANSDSLSGGQKQRVAIARALSLNPDILLFDEPTSALDPEMVKEVLNVIKSLTHDNRTMLIVTHEMKFAKEVANRIIFIDEGRVLENCSPDKFFENNNNQRIKAFLANSNIC